MKVEYLTSKTFVNKFNETVMFFNVDGFIQQFNVPCGARMSASKVGKMFFDRELTINNKVEYSPDINFYALGNS